MSNIPIASIETELARIWESLKSENKVRASLFNLIVYTEKNERAAYFQKITKGIIDKFPSRVIFITLDRKTEKENLSCSVSVLSPHDQGSFVACDFIQFDLSISLHERIPFLILPHLIPDLPIYLVWGEDPCQDDPISYGLENLAHRTIFDSETANHLPNFAKALLNYSRLSHSTISDLNWARIESFRNMLTSYFNTQDNRSLLQEITNVEITYNNKGSPFFSHTRIQSLYLQAFLAVQLNWKLEKLEQSCEKTELFYQKIHVTLIPKTEETLPPGMILSLHLTTQAEELEFLRTVQYPQQITMRRSNKSECSIPTSCIFAKGESGQSLVREISHKETSQQLLQILKLLSEMPELAC